jgi:hypothetical protein
MFGRHGRLRSVIARGRDAREAVIRWRALVEQAWGAGPRLATLDAVTPLMVSALRGATFAAEALTALGHRAGFDGHPLEEVADWVSQLLPLVPRRVRTRVRQFSSACLLADAWAAGRLAARPASNVDQIGQLELRLRELYERCATLGVRVDRQAALAVLAFDGLPNCPESRGAVLADAAASARRIFSAGESVAVLELGRLLVLAERTPALAFRTRRLAEAVQRDIRLEGVQVRHWIEPLPPDRAHLAAHLRVVAA